jgi:hypothetical protein
VKATAGTPGCVRIACCATIGLALSFGALAAGSIKMPDFREEALSATPCAGCGTVRSIRELATARPRPSSSTLGPPVGTPQQDMLVGAVFFHSFSGTSGPYVGGVGTPEMRARFEMTSYELTVRMDEGGFQVFQLRDGASFQAGDRVRVVQGKIERI